MLWLSEGSSLKGAELERNVVVGLVKRNLNKAAFGVENRSARNSEQVSHQAEHPPSPQGRLCIGQRFTDPDQEIVSQLSQ
jgi:hypothetical protein